MLAFLCQGEGDAGAIAQPPINVCSSCPNHSKLCVAKPSRLQCKHNSSRVVGTVNAHPKQGSVWCVFSPARLLCVSDDVIQGFQSPLLVWVALGAHNGGRKELSIRGRLTKK